MSTSHSVDSPPLLEVKRLKKYFPLKGSFLFGSKQYVQAVDYVSFAVRKGETLGIVGESGCGKSTTARLIMHLITPDAGEIYFDAEPIAAKGGLSIRQLRQRAQMVFQDSYSSLNPRLPIEDTIAFGPRAYGTSERLAREKARHLLNLVKLDPNQFSRRYPHELSGGQRQRVNIARALALSPRLLILDEAVSALDKSVEAQVLNLLVELKRELQLTYLFISHDLNVVQYISDRVLVMYLGKVVEVGRVDDIYERPRHPYTQALLASRPSMDPYSKIKEAPLVGDPPNPVNPPSGCRFRTRCAFAEETCAANVPGLFEVGQVGSHAVACHIHIPGSGHSRAFSLSRDSELLDATSSRTGRSAK